MATTNIKITATDKTQRAFSSVRRSIGGLQKSAIGLKSVLGVLIGGAMIMKMRQFSGELMDTADNLDKVSYRTGLTTNKLQELTFAMKLVGGTGAEVEKNLQKFAQVLDQAKEGAKMQSEAFTRLGVDLKDSNNVFKSSQQIFNELADAFSTVKDKTEALALAQIIFGRGGAKMVNLFASGAKGVEVYGKMLSKAGGVMSKRFVDGTINVNDSLTLWKEIIGTNTSRILTPFLESFLDISDAMLKFRGVNPLGLASMDRLLRQYNELSVEIVEYQNEIKNGIPWYKQLLRVTEESRKASIKEAKAQQTAIAKEMLAKTKQAKESSAIHKAKISQGKKEIEQTHQISEAEQNMYESGLSNSFKKFRVEKENAIKNKQRENELILEITSYRRTAEEQRTFDIQTEGERRLEIIREFLRMQGAMEIENDGLMIEQRLRTAKKLKEIDIEKRDSALATSKELLRSMGSANKSWFDANKALAISETLISTYASATKALGIQPPWVGMAYAGTITALGLANANRISQTKYEARAMGGNVNAGQTYLVGEQGRELFTPNQNGHITPNHELGTTVNFNITTNDAQGFDDLLQDRRGMIVSMINRASNENGRGNLI